MPHWTEETKRIEDWYDLAAILSAEVGPFDEVPCRKDDKLVELVTLFMSETKRLSEYDTDQKAIAAFEHWLTKSTVPAPEHVTLSFSMTKHYGAVDVQFGYSAPFTVPNEKRLARAFLFCREMVEKEFDAFERGTLHKLSTAFVKPEASQPASQPSTETVSFFGDTLEVERRDDKLYYKVKGGQFEKFGVRVWPEVLKAGGVDIPKSPGSYSLARDVLAQIQGDKVKKVIAIQ